MVAISMTLDFSLRNPVTPKPLLDNMQTISCVLAGLALNSSSLLAVLYSRFGMGGCWSRFLEDHGGAEALIKRLAYRLAALGLGPSASCPWSLCCQRQPSNLFQGLVAKMLGALALVVAYEFGLNGGVTAITGEPHAVVDFAIAETSWVLMWMALSTAGVQLFSCLIARCSFASEGVNAGDTPLLASGAAHASAAGARAPSVELPSRSGPAAGGAPPVTGQHSGGLTRTTVGQVANVLLPDIGGTTDGLTGLVIAPD